MDKAYRLYAYRYRLHCYSISYVIVIRFGCNNPYMDKDYRILGVACLMIEFFVEIMADSFKNVLKRGYLDELISSCKHAMLVISGDSTISVHHTDG